MTLFLWSLATACLGGLSPQVPEEANAAVAPQFEAPSPWKSGGEVIRLEEPGFAAPCYFDVDGDGKKDLIVGQFAKGRMMVYKNLGNQSYAKGEWLQAGGEPASVPGVW